MFNHLDNPLLLFAIFVAVACFIGEFFYVEDDKDAVESMPISSKNKAWLNEFLDLLSSLIHWLAPLIIAVASIILLYMAFIMK